MLFEALRAIGVFLLVVSAFLCVVTGRVDSAEMDLIGVVIAILGITAILTLVAAYWAKKQGQ